MKFEYGGISKKSFARLAAREQTKRFFVEAKGYISDHVSISKNRSVKYVLSDRVGSVIEMMPISPRSLALPYQDEVITVIATEKKEVSMDHQIERLLSLTIGSAIIGTSLAGLYGGIGMAFVGAILSYVIEKSNKKG
jgi:hypothetical protein